MKRIIILFIPLCFMFSISACLEKKHPLQAQIESLIDGKQAQVGVAVIGYNPQNELIEVNGNFNYPMQSVYKFHLALAVMDKVEKGELSLNELFIIFREFYEGTTYSPMLEKYTDPMFQLSLKELLNFSLKESDNAACDVLFDIAGGTGKVNEYIQSLGIEGMNIAATEKEMHDDPERQYSNWSTPAAAVKLLEKFYSGNLLSFENRDFLLQAMRETETGENRIKAFLPLGTSTAHKTGSGPEIDGIITACNDIGLITFAGSSNYFIIAVFITDSSENRESNERIIADIAKAACDYYGK